MSGSRPAFPASAQRLKVVMAQLDFLVGDIPGNTDKVIEAAHRAWRDHQADVVVFPELCLTGYPPEDLLLRPSLDLRVQEALERLQGAGLEPTLIIGVPLRDGGLLYNAAVVLERGVITGRYFKRFPPNYQVFDEKRYFAEGRDTFLTTIRGIPVGITVCEDIWKDGPVEDCAAAGAPVAPEPQCLTLRHRQAGTSKGLAGAQVPGECDQHRVRQLGRRPGRTGV